MTNVTWQKRVVQDLSIRLATDMALGVEGSSVRARHTLSRGEEVFCCLSWAKDLVTCVDVDAANECIDVTADFWRNWLGEARLPDHRWREPIQRAALTVKGLTYMPTGATVAALTTSLPESPGGERNWDYRYTWMRDATFTLHALHWMRLDGEAEEFMQFVADLEPNDDGSLQIMYGIEGERDLTERTLDELSGYAGAQPVRIGNGAYNQRQNDVFGAVLDSIYLHSRHSQRVPPRLWPVVESQAKCASDVWRQTDQGIWEARGEPQHYVSSKLMCWVAMDRAAKLAELRGEDTQAAEWAACADEIRTDIETNGVNADGVLMQHYGSDALDASVLLAAIFGFWPSRRPAPAQHGDGRAERSNRSRIRPSLSHRRDGRRVIRRRRHVPDLLFLAGLGAGDRWRDAGGDQPDGAPPVNRLPAWLVRRGV